MKNLLLGIIVFMSFGLMAQNKYTIGVETDFNMKEVINILSEGIDTYDRYEIDSATVTISSNENLSDVYFYSKSTSGFQVVSVEINKVKVQNYYTTKADGNQDCENATMVCDATSFSGNSNGHGTQELNGSNRGCLLGNEHESSWYYINVGSSGTLEMTISPTASDDYDWAIWGPFTETTANLNCPPTTTPIRCNYSNQHPCISWGWIFCRKRDYETGMKPGYSNVSSSSTGYTWNAPLNVQEDEVYILLIDNYSKSNKPFNLAWGGSAKLACIDVNLPVELTYFTGQNKSGLDIISWETETETNNDYFTLEHSADGSHWNEIHVVEGAGNSTTPLSYKASNRAQENEINYYRLTQFDYDGKSEKFNILAIKNENALTHVYSKNSGEILFNKIYKYELYNSMGQIILKGEDNKVSVKGLSQGVYILRTENNIQKFFIN